MRARFDCRRDDVGTHLARGDADSPRERKSRVRLNMVLRAVFGMKIFSLRFAVMGGFFSLSSSSGVKSR
jgi:hypothetical protein